MPTIGIDSKCKVGIAQPPKHVNESERLPSVLDSYSTPDSNTRRAKFIDTMYRENVCISNPFLKQNITQQKYSLRETDAPYACDFVIVKQKNKCKISDTIVAKNNWNYDHLGVIVAVHPAVTSGNISPYAY